MPHLVRPAMAQMASFIEALREGYSRDTLRPETPESIAQVAAEPDWFIRQINNPPLSVILPDGSTGERVPETVLWYVEGETFLGSIQVRHRLNEHLARWGGHIGYAVRPSARRQGHASAMLAGMLGHCRANLDLDQVLLTANTRNLASIRVIEKAGGVLQDTIPHPWIEGDEGRRYWIRL